MIIPVIIESFQTVLRTSVKTLRELTIRRAEIVSTTVMSLYPQQKLLDITNNKTLCSNLEF